VHVLFAAWINLMEWCRLAAQPDIDGFLVGGASLKAEEFRAIINLSAKVKA
jgi:triosephosphate isomerase